jgi:peptide/nickel transport system permease protein
MIRYILKRLIAMIPTLLGITVITFFIVNLAPGDPVASQFGSDEGGGSAQAEGSGQGDQDRLADTIKAKKQLLGMLAEDLVAQAWSPNAPGMIQPLEWPGESAELPAWARSVAVAPDNATIYVGTKDGALVSLDRELQEIRRWEGHHSASIGAVALSPDGRHIATADDAGNIRTWSVDGASPVGSADGDGKPIGDLLFVDNDQVLAASNSGIIQLHRFDTGLLVRTYDDHIGAVYALETAGDDTFWSGGIDKKLRRWAVDGTTPLAVIEGHGQAITDIEAAADGTLVTGCDDRLVRIWSREGDSLGEPVVLAGHFKKVTAVAVSPDGTQIWSGSRDESVRQWDRSGTQLGQSPENPGRVRDIAILDGKALAVGDFWRKVPIYSQYLGWLYRTANLDFGRSFVDDDLVINKLAKALPITIGLNLLAIFIIYLISIPLGIYAAVGRGGTFDNVTTVVLFVLYSIPNFWLATILIMTFSSERNLTWFPSGSLHGPDPWSMTYLQWLTDWGWHLVLPITVMVYAGFASLSRYVRTSMLEALSQDYIRTARAKGLAERVVVFKHALRNALITIVTLIANLLPRMIGGSIIIEYIFSINGMGKLGFDAILSRDYPLVMAITTFSAVLTLTGILISDILYSVVDPRVKVDA